MTSYPESLIKTEFVIIMIYITFLLRMTQILHIPKIIFGVSHTLIITHKNWYHSPSTDNRGLTLKQLWAKKFLKSFSVIFSRKRLNGIMCEFGAILNRKNSANFIYTRQLYQCYAVLSWSPVRVIPYWSSITTGGNIH